MLVFSNGQIIWAKIYSYLALVLNWEVPDTRGFSIPRLTLVSTLNEEMYGHELSLDRYLVPPAGSRLPHAL